MQERVRSLRRKAGRGYGKEAEPEEGAKAGGIVLRPDVEKENAGGQHGLDVEGEGANAVGEEDGAVEAIVGLREIEEFSVPEARQHSSIGGHEDVGGLR